MRLRQTWHLRFLFPTRMESLEWNDWPTGCFSVSPVTIVFEVLSCWCRFLFQWKPPRASPSVNCCHIQWKYMSSPPHPQHKTQNCGAQTMPSRAGVRAVLSSRELHNRNAGLLNKSSARISMHTNMRVYMDAWAYTPLQNEVNNKIPNNRVTSVFVSLLWPLIRRGMTPSA